jgi:hypothetical protein
MMLGDLMRALSVWLVVTGAAESQGGRRSLGELPLPLGEREKKNGGAEP